MGQPSHILTTIWLGRTIARYVTVFFSLYSLVTNFLTDSQNIFCLRIKICSPTPPTPPQFSPCCNAPNGTNNVISRLQGDYEKAGLYYLTSVKESNKPQEFELPSYGL